MPNMNIRKRLLQVLQFGLLLSMAQGLSAECNPFVGGWECDFKDEDTHLVGVQPAYSFVKDDRVDELIEQGESFIHNYMATVKTTGDAANHLMLAPGAAKLAAVEIQQAINAGVVLSNDPWNLKTFLDIQCTFIWEAIGTITGVPRDCPNTADLLTDFQTLAELDEVRQKVLDIVSNPNLILGETWANSITEIQSLRNRIDGVDSFSRTLGSIGVEQYFDNNIPDIASLIALPSQTAQQANNTISNRSLLTRNTIQKHIMATKENYRNLIENDIPELQSLSDMSLSAIGKMQTVEIDNMLRMQGVQGIQSLSEELMNINSLHLQSTAAEQDSQSRRSAVMIKSAEPIPFHEVILNNGRGFEP